MRKTKNSADAPVQNRLLAALQPAEYDRIAPHLDEVPLKFGQVLHEAGGAIKHVYFPNSGTVSLIAVVSPLKGTQIGLFGDNGVAGMSAALGTEVSPLRAMVQGPGTAMRLAASHLRREFAGNLSWNHELMRFSTGMLAQAARNAACNRFHTVESRLANWLLTTRDRLNSNDFTRTHQFLALMLGVRRVGITEAASAFEEQGLISYSRGNIRITNLAGLEAASCGCYRKGNG